MTAVEAKEIKKIIKEEVGKFTVYFNSKKGELRITVVEWQDGCSRKFFDGIDDLEKEKILNILNALTKHGKRPKYHKEFKRYQGFINCRYIVFE